MQVVICFSFFINWMCGWKYIYFLNNILDATTDLISYNIYTSVRIKFLEDIFQQSYWYGLLIVQGVIAQIPEMILKYVNRDEVALAVAQKVLLLSICVIGYILFSSLKIFFFLLLAQVFNSLYENVSNSIHVAAHLSILAAIRDVCKNVMKHLTSWVCGYKQFIAPIVGLRFAPTIFLFAYYTFLSF